MEGLSAGVGAWSRTLGLSPGVLIVLAATLATLATGSLLRLGFHALRRTEASPRRLRSLGTWWVIVLAWVGAVLLGPPGVTVLMAGASAAALHEYLSLVRPGVGRGPILLAYGAIPLQYGAIALQRLELALMATPALISIAALATLLPPGRRAPYSAAAGKLVLGPIVTVYALSFAAMFPAAAEGFGIVEGMGWFVLLVLLTEAGDIAQALVGRPLGKHRILPAVSPGKTWEGWVGGAIATTTLGAAAGPALTPLSIAAGAAAGALVAVVGPLGDMSVSALKRERGVKDSGRLLPGQGGMLDRVDGLCFAAPVLFLYAGVWLAVAG